MHQQTLAQTAQQLADKSISAVELTQHYLARIKQHNPELNCLITTTEETALTQAQAADQRIADGSATALTGIPIIHKDNICTQGHKTSCGSKMLDNFVSPYNATVAEQLNAAGAVLLGKANLDEFAMGSSNETSYYGPAKNPWDIERVPGGSSGGSAAAIAARLAFGATGSDTGGSIRQPASLCGITGLKPTYGRISRYGLVAFASSLDQIGPFAPSAEDIAYLMNAMAGHDPRDETSRDVEVPDYTATLNDSLAGLTIGMADELFDGLDPQITACIEQTKEQLIKLGAQIKPIHIKTTAYNVPTYYIIAPCEASSNLARFDGVRYGYRCDNPVDLDDLYSRSRSEGFGDEVKKRILIGTFALSSGFYDAYYQHAQKVRSLIRQEYVSQFENVDVILGPIAPNTAFKLNEKLNDPISMYLNDLYSIPQNLAGLPAISAPAGFIDGLPIGLQLTGNFFQEAKLLNVVHQYQQVTDWHQQMPTAYTD